MKKKLKGDSNSVLPKKDFSHDMLSDDLPRFVDDRNHNVLQDSALETMQRGVYEVNEKAATPEYNSDEDTIYFKPCKIYRMGRDLEPKQSAVRLHIDTGTSNFNEGNLNHIYDDDRHRSVYNYCDTLQGASKQIEVNKHCSDLARIFEVKSNVSASLSQEGSSSGGPFYSSDMQDEYIPNLDFVDTVKRWQVEDENPSRPAMRYNMWSEEDSEFNPPSASSDIVGCSHAQVSPIPFPNSESHSAQNSSIPVAHKTIACAGLRVISPTAFTFKFRHPQSTYDWGSLLSVCSLDSLSDTVTKDEIKAITDKIPEDFFSLPYTQRKKLVLELAPDKDYRTIMHIFKRYNLMNSSNASKLNTQNQRRSRHGSLASQYLSSLTPSSSSFKPDERGSLIMGYRLGKIIGFGAWGMIRECYDVKETSFICSPSEPLISTKAIKVVKFRNNIKVKRQALREISIWKKLKHPNILELLDWKLEEDYATYCLTEKLQDGTLYDLVFSWGDCKTTTTPYEKRCLQTISLAIQLISAVNYMHSKCIVHADIKLENCLLRQIDSKSWQLYVCDFGMSCHFVPKKSNDDNRVHGVGQSISFPPSMDCKVIVTRRRSLIPRSASNSNVSSLIRLQKLMKNRKIFHEDNVQDISSVSKQFDPSVLSTTMSASHKLFKLNSCGSSASDEKVVNSDEASSNVSKGMEPHSHIGSLPYASPELIDPTPPPLAPSADIWAFGVTIYAMLTGRLPFEHEFEPRLRAMISSGKYDVNLLGLVCDSHPAQENTISRDTSRFKYHGLYNAVRGCLTKDTTKRWKADMIISALNDVNSHK